MGIIVDSTTQGISDSNKQWVMIHRDKTPALLLIEEGIFFAF